MAGFFVLAYSAVAASYYALSRRYAPIFIDQPDFEYQLPSHETEVIELFAEQEQIRKAA